jgi:hypothetical protein
MKFPHMNAEPEELWRWFAHPNSTAEVELKLLTRTEMESLTKAQGGIRGENKRIARDYFRDFKGCRDAKGNEIPNTPENRSVMLEDLEFGGWLVGQLMQIGEWRNEGKGDSGTAS